MFDHLPLQIWQRSHTLSLVVDKVVLRMPRRAAPGLARQISTACSAIPANIAECAGQATPPQSARFLDIAIGSSSETEGHIARALGLGLISVPFAESTTTELREVRRMMLGFRKWILRDRE